MQKWIVFIVLMLAGLQGNAQSPVGQWKIISETVDFGGQKLDMHAALLQRWPCADKIVYDINADTTFRLNASNSGCDEQYKKVQERLYSNSKWKMEGNQIMISATNFAVGQSYTVTFSGNQMTWTGTEGQGVTVYQKL